VIREDFAEGKIVEIDGPYLTLVYSGNIHDVITPLQ
jgi:hypothetical protein